MVLILFSGNAMHNDVLYLKKCFENMSQGQLGNQNLLEKEWHYNVVIALLSTNISCDGNNQRGSR